MSVLRRHVGCSYWRIGVSDLLRRCASSRRQVDNRIKHSKAGTVETVPERKKKIVKELT